MSSEFLRGLATFRGIGPTATVYGSARFSPGSEYYELARRVGSVLAQEGLTVMTGGGPGLMEAVSLGAKEAGGKTAACNIALPHEQSPNAYVDRLATFSRFSSRKDMLARFACCFVVLPGGFGTLDELHDVLAQLATGKLKPSPVFLVGGRYWRGYMDWAQGMLLSSGSIGQEDLERLILVESDLELGPLIRAACTKITQKIR